VQKGPDFFKKTEARVPSMNQSGNGGSDEKKQERKNSASDTDRYRRASKKGFKKTLEYWG